MESRKIIPTILYEGQWRRQTQLLPMEIQWWAWERDSAGIQSQVHHLFAGWTWKGHMTSLSFGFLIQKTEIVIQPIECTNKTDMAQTLKNLPAMQETWVWSLGREVPLEKEMTTHSSILAWEIPWTEEPGRLQSMGSLRVRHDWVTSLSLFTFMRWTRKWQPTPVFLPGESQGRGSLVGCHLWGRTESDPTEVT